MAGMFLSCAARKTKIKTHSAQPPKSTDTQSLKIPHNGTIKDGFPGDGMTGVFWVVLENGINRSYITGKMKTIQLSLVWGGR